MVVTHDRLPRGCSFRYARTDEHTPDPFNSGRMDTLSDDLKHHIFATGVRNAADPWFIGFLEGDKSECKHKPLLQGPVPRKYSLAAPGVTLGDHEQGELFTDLTALACTSRAFATQFRIATRELLEETRPGRCGHAVPRFDWVTHGPIYWHSRMMIFCCR